MAEEKSTKKKAINVIGTVLRIILTILASLILGVNVYILNARRLGGNQLPMPFGYGAAIVMSGSMSPALDVGDLVIVREVSENGPVRQEDLSTGDVVIYEDGNALVIHRIMAKDETGRTFVTKGDFNNSADSPVSYEDVRGLLFRNIRGVGNLLLMMRNPVFVVFLIAAVVIWTELSVAVRRKKAKAEADVLRREIEELKSKNEKTE